MGGILVNIKLEDRGIAQALQDLSDKIVKPDSFLNEAGIYLLSSVHRNFQEQGRPDRWLESQRVKKKGGQTLRKKGRLLNSITYRVRNNVLKVGTNVVYAAIQHFGGTIDREVSVKAHIRYYRHSKNVIKSGGKKFVPFSNIEAHSTRMNTTIPARPFMFVQEEDWPVIMKLGEDFFIPVGVSS